MEVEIKDIEKKDVNCVCMPDCRYNPDESENCKTCIRNPHLVDNYEPRLAACPFCGGKAELERDIHSHTCRVVCTVCKVAQPWNGSSHIAIKKWNNREMF